MAHVVLITQDPDVRIVLDVILHCEGNVVMSVLEGHHALPALEIGRYPAVVIVHAPTPAHPGLDLIQRAASSGGGQLARHAYIALTTHQSIIPPARRSQLARLKARVMELPVDLSDLCAAVEDAERELHAREQRAPTAQVAPRLSHP
jgi:DNA-binding NtrC family response regulator